MCRFGTLSCVVAALGCQASAVRDTDSGSETATDAPSESGSEESGSETETGGPPDLPVPTASVTGWVTDESGAPLAELPITLCGLVCQIANTDADGRFEVLGVDPGVKVLEPALVPVGDDLDAAVKSWTRFFEFVEVADGEAIVLDEPFVMLRVNNTVGPLSGPQMLQPLPELSLEFDADVFAEAGALPVGIDEPWLGARAVPNELWPEHGLGDWNIVAAFALAVWDLEAPDAFAVEAALPDALAPDAEVAFLVADYEYGFQNGVFFEEPALLSDDGLHVMTPADGGLDRATMWLVVTR